MLEVKWQGQFLVKKKYCQIISIPNKKWHISFLHAWKAIDHTVLFALSYFRNLFCCRLMNIFLTQFWTVKLLIHKPQPCLSDMHIKKWTVINYLFRCRSNDWGCRQTIFVDFTLKSIEATVFDVSYYDLRGIHCSPVLRPRVLWKITYLLLQIQWHCQCQCFPMYHTRLFNV